MPEPHELLDPDQRHHDPLYGIESRPGGGPINDNWLNHWIIHAFPPDHTPASRLHVHERGSRGQVCDNINVCHKPVPSTLLVEYGGQSAGFDTRVGLTAKATISREKFGLGQGMMGRFAASETATIEIALETVRKPMEAQEAVAKADEKAICHKRDPLTLFIDGSSLS